MALLIGDTAPNFTAPSSRGEIELYQYKEGSWLVFFSHPGQPPPFSLALVLVL